MLLVFRKGTLNVLYMDNSTGTWCKEILDGSSVDLTQNCSIFILFCLSQLKTRSLDLAKWI